MNTMEQFLTTLTATQITASFGMSTREYTTFVNEKVNETDVIAEDCNTHVNLYLMPF